MGSARLGYGLSHDFDIRKLYLLDETELALRRGTEVQVVKGLGQALAIVILLLGGTLWLVDDRGFIRLPVSIY